MEKPNKILLLLVITIAISVLCIALYIVHKPQESELAYNDTTISNGTDKYPQNVFKPNIKPLKDLEQSSTTDNFTDWQNSDNIRHLDTTDTTNNTNTQQTNTTIAGKDEYRPVEAQQNQDNTIASDIWSWVPIIKNTKQSKMAQESTEIAEMRAFGNSYGSTIKRFTLTLGDQPKVMNGFILGRGKSGNTKEIIELGQKYIEISKDLNKISTPKGFGSTVEALTKAYALVGESTINLSKASDDADTVKRVYSYNEVVEDFAHNYLAMVDLFGAYGIKFNKGEGGDIFMPPM